VNAREADTGAALLRRTGLRWIALEVPELELIAPGICAERSQPVLSNPSFLPVGLWLYCC
jgi:hypothetical protein